MDSIHSQGSFQTCNSGLASNIRKMYETFLRWPVCLVSIPGGSVEPALSPWARLSHQHQAGLVPHPTGVWVELGVLVHFHLLWSLFILVTRLRATRAGTAYGFASRCLVWSKQAVNSGEWVSENGCHQYWLAVWPLATYLTALSLSFCLHIMGIVRVATL